MQVAEIAGNEKRHDLTLALDGGLIAAGEALQDKVHAVRRLAFADQLGPGLHLVTAGDNLVQKALVIRRSTRACVSTH